MRYGWIMAALGLLTIGCGGGSSTSITPSSDSDPITDANSPTLGTSSVAAFNPRAGANGVALLALSPNGQIVSAMEGPGAGAGPTLSTIGGTEISLPVGFWENVGAVFALSEDGGRLGYIRGSTEGSKPSVYSAADGEVQIPLPQWTYADAVTTISADGTTIGGLCRNAGGQDVPFTWSQATGFRALPVNGLLEADVTALSADGRVAVGGKRQARRWVDGGAAEILAPTGYRYSYALDVSADGNAVAGYLIGSDGNSTAYRWTDASGLKRLGHYPGFASSVARYISADGKVVVGEVEGPGPLTPFVWTSASGIKLLRDLVPGGNAVLLNPEGPVRVQGLSADGHTVIGGTYSNTTFFPEHAWVAHVGF